MKTLTNFRKRYPYVFSLGIIILNGRIFPYGEFFLRKNLFRIRGR